MDKVMVVENLFSERQIESLLSTIDSTKSQESRVGNRVDPAQKIREDYFFPSHDCEEIDSIFFSSCDELIHSLFGITIEYRERWKIGFYSGEKRGHYIPHTDTQGKMAHRQLSCAIALSHPHEYEGGEFILPELDRQFRLNRGSAIIFDSSLLHGVLPVRSGERRTLLTFMFDKSNGHQSGKDLAGYKIKAARTSYPSVNTNNGVKYFALPPEGEEHPTRAMELSAETIQDNSKNSYPGKEKSEILKYLIPLTPDSGPGNQMVSIKEALLMGHYLNRKVVLPDIYQHYTEGRDVWRFLDIFEYSDASSAVTFEAPAQKPDHIYVAHPAYLDKRLKSQQNGAEDIPETLLANRKFRSKADYAELQLCDEEVLCVKHLFNNTIISNCGINGCMDCDLNPKFEKTYSKICKNLDFSKEIRKLGDAFIARCFNDNYIAVHMRYPDVLGGKTFEQHSRFSEEEISEAIDNFAYANDVEVSNVFIATNKPKLAQQSALKKYRFLESTLDYVHISFLEQYICCRSKYFLSSNFNDYSKIDKPHQRSTWSSFVVDYRHYKTNNDRDYVLSTVVSEFRNKTKVAQ